MTFDTSRVSELDSGAFLGESGVREEPGGLTEPIIPSVGQHSRSATISACTRDPVVHGSATLLHADCLHWLEQQPPHSIHAVVTDPPYGLREYSEVEQSKLRRGRGGVWRIPPSFDGVRRAPLPRLSACRTCTTSHIATTMR